MEIDAILPASALKKSCICLIYQDETVSLLTASAATTFQILSGEIGNKVDLVFRFSQDGFPFLLPYRFLGAENSKCAEIHVTRQVKISKPLNT